MIDRAWNEYQHHFRWNIWCLFYWIIVQMKHEKDIMRRFQVYQQLDFQRNIDVRWIEHHDWWFPNCRKREAIFFLFTLQKVKFDMKDFDQLIGKYSIKHFRRSEMKWCQFLTLNWNILHAVDRSLSSMRMLNIAIRSSREPLDATFSLIGLLYLEWRCAHISDPMRKKGKGNVRRALLSDHNNVGS